MLIKSWKIFIKTSQNRWRKTKEPQQAEVPLPRKDFRCKSFKNNLKHKEGSPGQCDIPFSNFLLSIPPRILSTTKKSHTNRGGVNQTKILPHPIGLHTEPLRLIKEQSGHSLLERLVDGGIGVQAVRTGVHELGGVMWGHRGHAVGLCRVGDAGHDRHDLCDLLLQIFYLLLLLQILTCVRDRERIG